MDKGSQLSLEPILPFLTGFDFSNTLELAVQFCYSKAATITRHLRRCLQSGLPMSRLQTRSWCGSRILRT